MDHNGQDTYYHVPTQVTSQVYDGVEDWINQHPDHRHVKKLHRDRHSSRTYFDHPANDDARLVDYNKHINDTRNRERIELQRLEEVEARRERARLRRLEEQEREIQDRNRLYLQGHQPNDMYDRHADFGSAMYAHPTMQAQADEGYWTAEQIAAVNREAGGFTAFASSSSRSRTDPDTAEEVERRARFAASRGEGSRSGGKGKKVWQGFKGIFKS
ncbi:hypothetical protein CBS101457_003224 [Exobasidium rhododendri]|nr:hypothetical protein CBS101457_003224 [Exobasidium rhododendri]